MASSKNTKNKNNSTIKDCLDFVLSILYAFLLATLVKSIFYENFKVPSGSMNPTLISGDRILVNKFYYGYSKFSFPFSKLMPIKSRILSHNRPKYGDIVVFKHPHQENTDIFYIKRVIGLPGDEIMISKGKVFINKVELNYDFVDNIEALSKFNYNSFNVREYNETNLLDIEYKIYVGSNLSEANNTKIYTVPNDSYFLMGDNRDNSKDSRFHDFGTIPFSHIVGRAEYIYLSLNIDDQRTFKPERTGQSLKASKARD